MPTFTDPIENQLADYIRAHQHELVTFCSRLIQTPSVNGVDDEAALADVIAAKAREFGLSVMVTGENPRRPNVIVSTAEQQETGLLLLGHLDSVPAGDEANWDYPPFAGFVTADRVYGRGAIDTKGGMAASLFALAALTALGGLEQGRAQLICVPDEESGATGDLGIKYLHANGLLHAKGAIYAYSGNQITLGHRGLLRYRLIASGIAVHTGASEWQDKTAGANAVTGMADLLIELENTPTDYSKTRYFERFKTVITPGTIISGGTSINIVPDQCEALVDIRLTPEFDREGLEVILDAAIARVCGRRPSLKLEYQLLNDASAVLTDENAAIVHVLDATTRDVTGIEPVRVVAGPANEGYLLVERGIPTICGFGPTGENAHAANEYVEIEGLVNAAIIFALTARRMSRN